MVDLYTGVRNFNLAGKINHYEYMRGVFDVKSSNLVVVKHFQKKPANHESVKIPL